MKEIAIDATTRLKQAVTNGGEVKIKEENEQLKVYVTFMKEIAVDATTGLKQAGTNGGEVKLKKKMNNLRYVCML